MRYDYDYIIVGLGAAGMSLAYYLAHSSILDHQKVLILEKDPKNKNDRTWTFWGDPPAPIDQLIQKTWKKVLLRDGSTAQQVDASTMPYHYLTALQFYQALLPDIQAHPNITWLQAPVSSIDQDEQAAYVTANEVTYATKYVFNSGYVFTTSLPDIQDEIYYQRFSGWEVVFDQSILDDSSITLMDFALPHSKDLRFMYSLPLSSNRLIINCTVFGQEPLPADYYHQQLAEYLEQHYPGANYRIERKEGGMIPMSHKPLQRYWGNKVMNMGILGGDTRPSTGYTFLNAVRIAKQVVQSLNHQLPLPSGQWGPRQQFYDKLFLQVLADNPHHLRKSLMALFRNNQARTIFRFLDGSSYLWEEIKLVLTLPYAPFIKALAKQLKPKTQTDERQLLPAKD